MRLLERLNTPKAFLILVLALLAVNGGLVLVKFSEPEGIFASTRDVVLVGAGDIADCSDPEGTGSTGGEDTATLLDGITGTVFTAGDNAYPYGTDADFNDCYGPSWGRHKARTYPAPGDHEYLATNEASGYFNYFGAVAGDPSKSYYSYNLGEWHIVVLNTKCGPAGGCGDDSPELRWLKEDLAANPKACTLAYWHHPLFSSGHHGNNAYIKPIWNALYAANADVVVNGHDHDYERFAPQDPAGVADPVRGIREFVVGTGGAALRPFETIEPNSEVRNADTHGVLKLTLHPTGYDWEFVPVAGETFTDSGSGRCH